MYTTKDVADRLHMPVNSVRNAHKRGHLPGERDEKQRLWFSEAAITHYLHGDPDNLPVPYGATLWSLKEFSETTGIPEHTVRIWHNRDKFRANVTVSGRLYYVAEHFDRLPSRIHKDDEGYLTTDDAAEALGVRANTIRHWCREKVIVTSSGRTWSQYHIHPDAIDAFLEAYRNDDMPGIHVPKACYSNWTTYKKERLS